MLVFTLSLGVAFKLVHLHQVHRAVSLGEGGQNLGAVDPYGFGPRQLLGLQHGYHRPLPGPMDRDSGRPAHVDAHDCLLRRGS